MISFRFPLFLGLSALLLFSGFGCKKSPPPFKPQSLDLRVLTPTQNNAAPHKNPVTESETQKITASQIAPEIIYVRQILRNLTKTKSFRASMIIPTAQGTAKGEVEFSKDKGFHGTLQLPSGTSTEIYALNGNTIYFRANTSSWINMSGTTEGKQAALLFQTAFSVTNDNADTQISDQAKFVSMSDDPEGCRSFSIDQSTVVTPQLFELCVKNELPVRISLPVEQGRVEVRYRDYNQPIDIHVPTVK